MRKNLGKVMSISYIYHLWKKKQVLAQTLSFFPHVRTIAKTFDEKCRC